jgi:hypothetical protein
MFKLGEKSALEPPQHRSAKQMNAKAKIRIDSIERAHHALDALPEHRPDELTKTQAIQRLIVPIRATRSKGYSLAAIGKVLSECGIPITTGALRAYISEANTDAGGRRKKKPKRAMSARKETESAAPKSIQSAGPSQTSRLVPKPTVADASRTVDQEGEAAPGLEKPATPSVSSRRHSFVVRPDTKDI